jgi:transposase-like protein
MAKVQESSASTLAEARWRFAAQLWRSVRSAGRQTVQLSIQGATDARIAACRGPEGETIVRACPGCGSIDRSDFRKNGSYQRQLMTAEGQVTVRVQRLRCRCGKSIPMEHLAFAPRRRFSFDFLAMVLELVGMRAALRAIVHWAARRGVRVSLATLSRMLGRLELPVLGPLACSPSEISVDAMYVRLWDRERPPGWESEKAAVLLAVNHDPRLPDKVIGMVFAPAETEEGYRSLADQLLSRGMDPHAPLVVVSDGAQVIPAGFRRSFTNVAFQRCQWHLAQEIKDLVPPSMKDRARRDAWWVLRAPSLPDAQRRLARFRQRYTELPDAARALARALPDATLCLRRPVIQRTNGRAERYVRELRRHYRPREAFRSTPHAVRRIAFWTPVINTPHTGHDWLANLFAAQLGLSRRLTQFPAPLHT